MNIDPIINVSMLVLNSSMLLALVICITLGRRKLKARKRTQAVTLLQAGDQCWQFCRLLSASSTCLPLSTAGNGYHLPPLKEGDRL